MIPIYTLASDKANLPFSIPTPPIEGELKVMHRRHGSQCQQHGPRCTDLFRLWPFNLLLAFTFVHCCLMRFHILLFGPVCSFIITTTTNTITTFTTTITTITTTTTAIAIATTTTTSSTTTAPPPL